MKGVGSFLISNTWDPKPIYIVKIEGLDRHKVHRKLWKISKNSRKISFDSKNLFRASMNACTKNFDRRKPVGDNLFFVKIEVF